MSGPPAAWAATSAVRTAYARHADPVAVVDRCVGVLGAGAPRLVVAFCGGKLDAATILRLIRLRFGDVPVLGGSAAGVISRGGFGYSGLELGLIAFYDLDTTPHALIARGLDGGEFEAGQELGSRIRAVASEGAVTVLLFDSVASASPARLHHASPIVDGIHEGLAGRRICLSGGGLLTDMNFTDSWLYDGEGVAKHAAAALVFPPTVAAGTAILHGCRPVSAFMEITRIEGAEVFELDGQPALGVIERMLGLPLGGGRGQELSLVATLGQKHGDPYAPYDENAYVNRLILRADPESGSVTLFEPDFRRGARVQVMSRDNTLMLASARRGVAALNDAVAGEDPLLCLYFDCAGRASGRSGALVEEAELVARGLDPSAPFLGFYSGVEVAPFGAYSRPLDWTGVLTMLVRRP